MKELQEPMDFADERTAPYWYAPPYLMPSLGFIWRVRPSCFKSTVRVVGSNAMIYPRLWMHSADEATKTAELLFRMCVRIPLITCRLWMSLLVTCARRPA